MCRVVSNARGIGCWYFSCWLVSVWCIKVFIHAMVSRELLRFVSSRKEPYLLDTRHCLPFGISVHVLDHEHA